jgi:tyrosyl-tRNA synthetase
VPTDVPEFDLPVDDPTHLPALLRAAGLAASASEARRAITAGSVRLNGDRVDGAVLDLPRADLAGRVLQLGKRKAVRLIG